MKCSSCSSIVNPIVAVDIDGTLGDYHSHFHKFAEDYFGFPLPEWYDGSVEFSDWLGLPKHEYRQAKLAYRQGGLKRTMPVFPDSAEMLHSLREAGAEVWLCTTRPWNRLDNIDPDTREWLRRNELPYDGLIFGEDKYDKLVDQHGAERIVGVFEDILGLCEQAHRHGLDVWQAERSTNVHPEARYGTRATTLWAAIRFVQNIKEWKKKNDE